jgi:MerR family transcriptional regulator, copper efflux regulator
MHLKPQGVVTKVKPLKAGELAKQAQVNVETLRYYEREGLLPLPERSEAGYRLYPLRAVQQVRFIKRAQELGFTLKEIKELLVLQAKSDATAEEVKLLAQNKLQVIENKISLLQEMKATLLGLSEACHGNETSMEHCPILQFIEADAPIVEKR